MGPDPGRKPDPGEFTAPHAVPDRRNSAAKAAANASSHATSIDRKRGTPGSGIAHDPIGAPSNATTNVAR